VAVAAAAVMVLAVVVIYLFLYFVRSHYSYFGHGPVDVQATALKIGLKPHGK
jgi:hypothetical protein